MLLWSVASGNVPHDPSQKADDRAHPERRSPSIVDHQVGDERRRQAGASADAGEYPAIRNAALAHGNPTCHKLIGRRINDRFPSAEKKPDTHKQQKCAREIGWDDRRQGREPSPPDDAPGQYASRTKPIREIAADRLKQSVSSY